MEDLHYDRICRTSRSESYLISRGENPMARLELHYAHNVVYGLLVIEEDPNEFSDDLISELRDRIDMDLVETADVPRDDFILTVYRGREIGTFVDPELLEETSETDADAQSSGDARSGA